MNKCLAILTLLLMPLSLFAHDGHGIFDGNNWYHYLINPEHVWLIVLAVALIWIIIKKGVFRLKKE